MKKITIGILILFMIGMPIYTEDSNIDFNVSLKITNIEPCKGKIFISIYDNAASFKKKEPLKTISVQADEKEISINEKLPKGEYVFFAYHDSNENEKLDRNFLGMPKEPVGYSNHKGGKPGGFNKLKIEIKEDSDIEIKLSKI